MKRGCLMSRYVFWAPSAGQAPVSSFSRELEGVSLTVRAVSYRVTQRDGQQDARGRVREDQVGQRDGWDEGGHGEWSLWDRWRFREFQGKDVAGRRLGQRSSSLSMLLGTTSYDAVPSQSEDLTLAQYSVLVSEPSNVGAIVL